MNACSLALARDLSASALPHRRPGLDVVFLGHRLVHVRPVGIRDPPIGHGAVRIVRQRALERTDGLLVVEGVAQGQPLVEITLRPRRFRGDGMMMVPQPVKERRTQSLAGVGIDGWQSRGAQQRGNSEYDGKDLHGLILHIIGFCSISDLHTTNDAPPVHGPFVPSPVAQVTNLRYVPASPSPTLPITPSLFVPLLSSAGAPASDSGSGARSS